MPDLDNHMNTLPPLAGGIGSTLFMQLFDLRPEVVLMAFIGAWIGIALKDAIPDFPDRKSAVIYFLKTLFIVFAGTVFSAWAIPVILKFYPDIAQKSVAGFTGFMLVYFYTQLIDLGKFLFELCKRVLSLKAGGQ